MVVMCAGSQLPIGSLKDELRKSSFMSVICETSHVSTGPKVASKSDRDNSACTSSALVLGANVPPHPCTNAKIQRAIISFTLIKPQSLSDLMMFSRGNRREGQGD